MDFKCFVVLLALGAADAYRHSDGGGYNSRVNGGWSVWSRYSECDASCGKGQQTRTRECNSPAPAYGGADCQGRHTQTRDCDAGYCPINGGWSSWSGFTECSATCGQGTKTRTRKCNSPAPAYGGNDCHGRHTQTRACDAGYCPINGRWSSWSGFTECSATCGQGTKTRTRKCNSPAPAYGGNDCHGHHTQTRACDAGYCPVNGGWTLWSRYGPCDAECGNGMKTRHRTCTNPAPRYGGADCEGESTYSTACFSGKRCPVHGGYGNWGSWSTCSKTCGGGVQTRERHCNNPSPRHGGNPCYGDSEESRQCNKHACPRRQPYYRAYGH